MKVKRWLAGAAALCMVGLCASCTGGAGTGESIAVTGDAAPLFYYSQGGLYMVRGDEKPRLLVEEVDLLSFSSWAQSLPTASGQYLLSPDGECLAFSPQYNSLEDGVTLYAVETANGKVKTVCEDLAVDLEQFGVWRMVFRFGADGSLYYIRQNREEVRTDLYAYKKGKSRLVAENVVSFCLGEDGRTILYYSGIEETGIPQQSSERFIQQWAAKYGTSCMLLKRLDIETGECTTLSDKANATSRPSYDPLSFSYIQFQEWNGTKYEERQVGEAPSCNSCPGCLAGGIHLSEGVHIFKREALGGWFLETDGQEPVFIESLWKQGTDKKQENEVRFVQADGAVYYYKDDASEPGQNNLFRLVIENGILKEKKALTNYVTDIKMGYKGGVFYFRRSFDMPNRLKILNYTDGTNTLSFESLPEDTAPFMVNGSVYLSAPCEGKQQQDIYTFDGHETTLVAEGVRHTLCANNQLYYTKDMDSPFSLYQGNTLVAENVDGVINLYEESQ